MAKLSADPVMQALREAGIADDNTSRVVIDLKHGHLPAVHIERHGDDKLIDVVRALAEVEITRKERPPEPGKPDILGYVWTDPRTGEQLRLAPEDVAVLVRAEPERPTRYVDRVSGPLWLTPDQAESADVCALGCEVCFPDPDANCPHHGALACRQCHANPGDCHPDSDRPVSCGYWRATGMHWDTCPNRRN